MKTFSYAEIKKWSPCYDPIKYIPETWIGTALDILDLKDVPTADRLWVVLRTDLVSEKCMRLFAVWCARQVQHLMKDSRSIAALDVVERFVNGEASNEARAAAEGAARAAAWAAAEAAAWAAEGAAEAAAEAARAAEAAWAAAGAAEAAGAAAWAAVRAARAARAAEEDAQISKLKEIILGENK